MPVDCGEQVIFHHRIDYHLSAIYQEDLLFGLKSISAEELNEGMAFEFNCSGSDPIGEFDEETNFEIFVKRQEAL